MPNNLFTLKKEKAMSNALYRFFRTKQKELVNILKAQDKQKGLFSDVREWLKTVDLWIVNILTPRTKESLNKWARSTGIKYNPDFEFDYDSRKDPAVIYLQAQETLNLSQAKWSIARTTHNDIIWILAKWVDEWLSPTEIAEWIQKTNPMVFSRARANLIAVTEVWRAYEFGAYAPMKDLSDKWERVLKWWLTAEDDKVRPAHSQNASDWLIQLDQRFSWTGDLFAPVKWSDWFNCRCSTFYEVL